MYKLRNLKYLKCSIVAGSLVVNFDIVVEVPENILERIDHSYFVAEEYFDVEEEKKKKLPITYLASAGLKNYHLGAEEVCETMKMSVVRRRKPQLPHCNIQPMHDCHVCVPC